MLFVSAAYFAPCEMFECDFLYFINIVITMCTFY